MGNKLNSINNVKIYNEDNMSILFDDMIVINITDNFNKDNIIKIINNNKENITNVISRFHLDINNIIRTLNFVYFISMKTTEGKHFIKINNKNSKSLQSTDKIYYELVCY